MCNALLDLMRKRAAILVHQSMRADCGLQIVESAKASLLALDEKIRSLAACGICTVAGKVPSAVDPHVLSAALLRLRDVKPSVRRSVAKEVTGMIRQLLTKNKAGEKLFQRPLVHPQEQEV